MKLNLETILEDVTGLVPVISQLTSAYKAYRTIWTAINPGKTEADFEAHLVEVSNQAISAADAILIQDGYHKDPAGNWVKG